jgi:hypothetical protein
LVARILAALDAGVRMRVADCCGTTTLLGSAWIHGHARLAISGDTVAMHLAAAAGAPALCLFGASNPVETGPYGRGHVIIQTDPHPAPDLALDREHAGLAHLRPEEVAGWILEGEVPGGFPMWETAWDEARGMQVLRDSRKRPHPAWERGSGLIQVLDRSADRPGGAAVHPMPRPDGARATLHRMLADADGRPADWKPEPEYLSRLQAAERELGEETRDSLVWEAYRIAVNGMPLRDLRGHLAARKARFELALGEEALAFRP